MEFNFQSAVIKGNLNSKIQSEIEILNLNAARRFENNIVTGEMNFTGIVTIDEFNGNLLNGIDLIIKNLTNLQINSVKKFNQLIIDGNIDTRSINTEQINEFNFQSFFIDSIKIDQQVICDEELIFNQLKCDSVTIDSNNQLKFIDEILIDSLVNVVIRGDVFIDSVAVLNFLNLIEIGNYMELTVSNYFGGVIGGFKLFERNVTINDLIAKEIKKIDLNEIFTNTLRRSKSQEIPAKWTFNQIDCFSLKSLIIDGINKNLLIEKTDSLEIFNDFFIDYLFVESTINGNLINVDLRKFEKNQLGQNWRNLTIYGTRNLIKSTIFDQLIKNCIFINENQLINGNLYFKNTVLFKKINNPVGNFNLIEIFNDSFKKNQQNQQINGKKIFLNQLKLNQLKSIDFNQLVIINDLNIKNINQSIFRLINDNKITGKKQFLANPLINQLKTDYLINNIYVKDLIFSYNNQKLINFSAKKINLIKNLTVNQLNQLKINDFLINKINKNEKTQVNSSIIFNQLIINNNNFIDSINNLIINDLIELKVDKLQKINNHLIINNLIINNKLLINNLNQKNLIDFFNQTIFINNQLKINNLIIKSVIFNQGINLINFWKFNQQKINQINKNSLTSINKKILIFSFIDYASEIELINNQELNPSNSTIYVNRVLPSIECSVNQQCTCPVQYRVTPLPTNKIIINKLNFFDRRFDLSNNQYSIKISTFFQSNCLKNKKTEILINEKFLTYFNDLVTDVKLINNLLIISWIIKSPTVHQINEKSNDLIQIQQFQDLPNYSVIELINNQEILIISNRQLKITVTYKLNGNFFKKNQEITGFYNLISGVITNDVMLILSMIESMKIQIFKLNQIDNNFELYQDIAFESKIKTVTAITTGTSILIGIALSDGYLSIYSYNWLQGWKLSTIGYFSIIESLVPIRIQQRDFILVFQLNTTSIVSINYI